MFGSFCHLGPEQEDEDIVHNRAPPAVWADVLQLLPTESATELSPSLQQLLALVLGGAA